MILFSISDLIRPTGTGSLFGAATTAAPAAQPTPASGGLFSSGGFSFQADATAAPVSGTQIKFVAQMGQDTVQKNGIQQSINTNHQCITQMIEYELKSLEELRFEDYQANRKFATAGTGAFGTSATGGLFGASTAPTTSTAPGTSTFGTCFESQPATTVS